MKKIFAIVITVFIGISVLASSVKEDVLSLPCIERNGPYVDGTRWFCALQDKSRDVNENERIICGLNISCDDPVCLVPLGTYLCTTYNPADFPLP